MNTKEFIKMDKEKILRDIGYKGEIKDVISREKLSCSKEFYKEIHKQAVIFRNKKRQQYLNNELNDFDSSMVECWDCEPTHDIQEEMKERGLKVFKKMFKVNLREEPLSIDILIEWRLRNGK